MIILLILTINIVRINKIIQVRLNQTTVFISAQNHVMHRLQSLQKPGYVSLGQSENKFDQFQFWNKLLKCSKE